MGRMHLQEKLNMAQLFLHMIHFFYLILCMYLAENTLRKTQQGSCKTQDFRLKAQLLVIAREISTHVKLSLINSPKSLILTLKAVFRLTSKFRSWILL